MHLLAPLAALLGIEVESITERLRSAIIINVVMAGLALLGIIFLVAAGYLALAEVYGAIIAALIASSVFLVLALAVYLGKRIAENRRRRDVAIKRRSTEASAFVTTAALTAMPALLKSPLGRAVGIPAAAVAAYMLLKNRSETKDD